MFMYAGTHLMGHTKGPTRAKTVGGIMGYNSGPMNAETRVQTRGGT